MFFESIMLPFTLGLVVNKTSQEIFKDDDLYQIVKELYHKSEDEFNEKYESVCGGKYNNFIARQENLEILLKNVLLFKDIGNIEELNVKSFDGSITPDEVVQDFLLMFDEKLNEDSRLIKYRGKREHYILTEEILEEIRKLKHVRISKFEDIISFVEGNDNIQPYIISKTDSEISDIRICLNRYEIVLIDSFRGFGKTETLLRAGLDDKVRELFDNVIIMKHGIRNVLDALQTEIVKGKNYLILIDDVDVCKDEFVQLLNFIRATKEENKILITTQTYFLDDIKTIITKAGFIKSFKHISINDWSKENFIELLRKVSGIKTVEDEEMIAVKYPSPALISWIGKAKSNSKRDSIEELFMEYKELMINDVFDILKDTLSKDECKKLIFNFSCTVPFKAHDIFKKLMSDLMKISENELETIINRLIRGGILRKVGYSYRFFPDIKGDIYLAYSLEDSTFTDDFNYWMNHCQETVLQNINEARFISSIDINKKLKSIINEWSIVDNYFKQNEILKKAYYIISFAPESILNLIYYYLEHAIRSKDDKYYKLTTDNFGPLILNLWNHCSNKEAILDFIRRLKIHDLEGRYDNYKVRGIIENLFSPINSSIHSISNSLDILKKWLEEDREKTLILVKYAVSEILKGSHKVTKTIINGIQYGQRIVNATDEVIDLRKKCVLLVKYLLDEKFQYKTVQTIEYICNNLGHMSWSSVSLDKLPLYDEIIRERKELVDIIGSKLIISANHSCNTVLERILINWWASQYKGTMNTEVYLKAYSRTPEYLFIKYYVDADYRIISFDEIENIAPKQDRWSWFVHNIMHNPKGSEYDSFRIAKQLHRKISTIQDFSAFLRDATVAIELIGICWSIPSILNEWCKFNKVLFKEYLDSQYYYTSNGIFRADILNSVVLSDGVCDRKIIDTMLENQHKLTIEEIYSVLTLATHKSLSDEYVVSVIQKIIDGNKLEYASNLIHRIYFIFKERDKKLVVNILVSIINKYPFNKQLRDILDFFLKRTGNELKNCEDFYVLKKIVIEKLIEIYDFDYHENSILETLIDNSEEALEFVVKRISSNPKESYRKAPFNGFTFLKKFINDVDEYDKLIALLIMVSEKGLIDSHYKSSIYKPLFSAKKSKDKLIVVQLLSGYIKNNKHKEVFEILNNIEVNSNTLQPFIEGITHLSVNSMEKEAEELIKFHSHPSDGWNRSVGEYSPEIVNRIELYKEMYNSLPFGKLRIVTERCVESLENEMKRDLIRDEEILNPR
ncbi:hypothetical protein [Wukongibacter baidiensis]